MTIRKKTPTIRGEEFAPIVLDAIPELGAALQDKNIANAHVVTRALLDFSNQAIASQDIETFIRCFTLARKLVDLDQEYDIFTASAIWAGYLNRFRRDDPDALAMIRGMDARVRESLYLPFTLPQCWMREVVIDAPRQQTPQSWLTVNREVEAEARIIRNRTCCGPYAVVRLALAPMLENDSVYFRNCLEESNDAPLECLHWVIEGIAIALKQHADERRSISYLRVDLTALKYHDVDSRKSAFVEVAQQAFDECLTKVGLTEITATA